MQKQRVLWHKRQDFDEVWREVLFFFLEHRATFANGLVVAPTMTLAQQQVFQRELELCGFFFRHLEFQDSPPSDFLSWLWEEVAATGGRVHDLSRVALLVPIRSSYKLEEVEVLRKRWSSRIPCPILFQLEEEDAWQAWFSSHRGLFGAKPWRFGAEVS